MAASVRVEDDAFKDERFEVLARVAGLADADHARGKMLRVWRQCTAQNTHVLSEAIVCGVLGQNGAEALVQSELGERVEGGIRIRGTSGRIEWLEKLRKNGKKGGRAKGRAIAKQLPSKSVARQEQEQEKEQDQEFSDSPPKGGASSRSRKPQSTGQAAISEFDGYYRRANGTAPTWTNTGNPKLIHSLVNAHGVEEVIRRIRILEKSPPKWPPAPWDVRTFFAHFDKLTDANMSGLAYAKAVANGDLP